MKSLRTITPAVLLVLVSSLAVFAAQGSPRLVSYPLAFQIDASASQEPGANLARLVQPGNSAGVAVGQWIDFDFGQDVALTGITLANGWGGTWAYPDHARVMTASLEYPDGSRQVITLRDTPTPQTIAVKGRGSRVRLTVTAIYPGLKGDTPYLSGVAFLGYDPSLRQVTMTGRFEGCVRSQSSSSWSGEEAPLYYCSRFKADDGKLYGCEDDLCFHPAEYVGTGLRVTGVVKSGDMLQVLKAEPVR